MIKCGFCQQELEIINHTNPEVFDIMVCEGCMRPDFDTRFRQVFRKGTTELLATTIRIDEFFIILNHNFNYSTKRTNYTQIFKKGVIGELDGSLDLQPVTWGPDEPAFDLDFILKLPLHDPALTKRKLQIYTTFS